ncbi:hypothetical protein GGR50DRAFT_666449 [Xylaria sp. CBS 124048]|nr:hypothetical protein GGR50DRAFT_666449 [Xylaria sp. CBS 124048]
MPVCLVVIGSLTLVYPLGHRSIEQAHGVETGFCRWMADHILLLRHRYAPPQESLVYIFERNGAILYEARGNSLAVEIGIGKREIVFRNPRHIRLSSNRTCGLDPHAQDHFSVRRGVAWWKARREHATTPMGMYAVSSGRDDIALRETSRFGLQRIG